MSPEDREAVRKALRAVWENPEVLQARDEVKRATEAFHQAIRKAVSQQDPRVAAMVGKMQRGGKSSGWEKKRPVPSDHPAGEAQLRKGQGSRPLEREGRGIGATGLLAFRGDFSKEEKARLEEVREKAMASEDVKRVQGELKALLQQGEDLRKQRVEKFKETREEILKAMTRVDPGVEPLLERMKKRKDG